MSQTDNVLALLRDRGTIGAHTFELRARYVGNPSQRIADLEARGHRFTRSREKLHGNATGTRYVLVVDADATKAPETDAPETLFRPMPASPYRGDVA